jgi:hypothetical protein
VPPPAGVPLGEWLRAPAPYRRLRSALLDAEALINGHLPDPTGAAWPTLRRAVGDPPALATAVTTLLDHLAVRPTLRPSPSGPHLYLVAPTPHRPLAAAVALAILIDASGPTCLKRCHRPTCDRTFLDWTNATTRTSCRLHRPPHPTP